MPVPAWHLRSRSGDGEQNQNPARPARFPLTPLPPVNQPPPHAALEEAAAAVAGVDAVVFAAAGVAAHSADQRGAGGLPRGRTLGCGAQGAAGLALLCLIMITEPETAAAERRIHADIQTQIGRSPNEPVNGTFVQTEPRMKILS